MTDQNRFTTALVLSLLLHLGMLLMLQTRMLLRQPTAMPESMDVDLVQLPPPPAVKAAPPAPPVAPQPQQQQQQAPPPPALKLPESSIVPMPDAGKEQASDKARFESDRDNTVERETVHRGQSFENEKAAAKKAEREESDLAKAEKADKAEKKATGREITESHKASAAAQREPEQVAALPKLDQLLPKGGDFVVGSKPVEEQAPRTAQGASNRRNLLAGRPVALSSRPGVAAYLPTVQEGDITLLNTKASQFAPFVRRVAARVFQHLEIALRQAANSTVAGTGHEYAEVEAVMSPSGDRISAILRQRQSETQLSAYRLLLGSTNPEVFFDRNPPSAAVASDGNIHFLLMIDLNVDVGADPATGRRGTSYYGIAGVGLE